MKAITAGLVTLGLVALVGCNTSPSGGSGGARGTGAGGSTSSTDTFKIQAPATSTTVKQGNTEEVTIKITRGKDFKEDVTVTFDAPKGLKVEPHDHVVKAGDVEEFKVKVSADKDAPLGDHEINVKGVAKGGGSIPAVAFKVKVDKGG